MELSVRSRYRGLAWITKKTETTESSKVFCYAGGRMDFMSGFLSPHLQAQFCKFYPAEFFGCN